MIYNRKFYKIQTFVYFFIAVYTWYRAMYTFKVYRVFISYIYIYIYIYI